VRYGIEEVHVIVCRFLNQGKRLAPTILPWSGTRGYSKNLVKIFRLTVCMALVWVSTLFFGCTPATIRHFWKVDLNAGYSMVGKHPVPDDEVARVNAYRIEYNGRHQPVNIKYLKMGMLSTDPSFLGNEVAQVAFDYTENSEKRVFLDALEKPVYSLRLDSEVEHQTGRLTFFDKRGKLLEMNGVATYVWTFDAKGRIVRSIHLDAQSRRISDSSGVFEARWHYDDTGCVAEERYYGEDGTLTASRGTSVAIVRRTYDDHENKIEERYYGTRETLTNDESWGVAIIQYEYDDRGNIIAQSFYDTQELPVESRGGAATWRFVYDEAGNRIETRWYGSNGRLKKNSSGVAIYRVEYDEQGRYKTGRFYDADGNLTKSAQGYAVIQREYDAEGKVSRTIFLDESNRIIRQE